MPDPRYKGRCIQLITPNIKQAEKYQKLAEKAGVPCSKYLLSIIEHALAENKSATPKAKLSEGMKELREENHKLREDLRLMTLMAQRAKEEVQQVRQAAFLDDRFQGERQISGEILAVLRRGSTHDYQLLEALDINPQDSVMVRTVHKQLEVLELRGLISKDRRGWRWKGK
jgi:hypothetical protein